MTRVTNDLSAVRQFRILACDARGLVTCANAADFRVIEVRGNRVVVRPAGEEAPAAETDEPPATEAEEAPAALPEPEPVLLQIGRKPAGS